MLDFLKPGLLIGLLALLIPVAIHLWNRQTGAIRWIGSTQWLIEGERKRFHSFQFSDLPLFCIRSLLFVLVTLLLAAPFFEKESKIRTAALFCGCCTDYPSGCRYSDHDGHAFDDTL